MEPTPLKPLPTEFANIGAGDEYAAWAKFEGWWAAGVVGEECMMGCTIAPGEPVYLTGVIGETWCAGCSPVPRG